MIFALIGIIIGIILGLFINYPIPLEFTRYTAVIIIGMLDALFGAMRAELTKNEYSTPLFLSGLLFNILLALGITFLGDKMGLDLYLAAAFVFTFRIFSNLGIIRRALFAKFKKQTDSVSSEE